MRGGVLGGVQVVLVLVGVEVARAVIENLMDRRRISEF